MKVHPLARKPRHRPFAILQPGRRSLRVLTAEGDVSRRSTLAIHRLLASLTDHACYVDGGLTALRHVDGATHWEATTWKGVATKMTHITGTTVRSLRGALDGESAEEQVASLGRFAEWLLSNGVGLSGVSSMARALWRSTLTEVLDIRTDPSLTLPAVYGGRQSARPKRYAHMVSLDITAAYPHSMAARPYALGFRRAHPSTRIDPNVAGLAELTVSIPGDCRVGPLPKRMGPDSITFPRAHIMRGTWPFCEVAAAIDAGAEVVRTHELWVPDREADLFGPWWPVVASGRALPGGAGRLAKMVSNGLWGTFAMKDGSKELLRWADDAGLVSYAIPLGSSVGPNVTLAHLAAETTGRVRTRILTDVLADPAIPAPVHCDTDGFLTRVRGGYAHLLGEGPGSWRVKRSMPRLEIKAAQSYRYRCGSGCGITHDAWHYSVAGVPASMAAEVFDRGGRGISYDLCVEAA